ncbi:MAG: hypothetical protein KIS62_07960 [Ramlibacter sp.]|nr:hypothetical protein [Ramlibacter sp.]
MAILWCAGLVAACVWGVQAGQAGWRLGVMAACVVASGAWALRAHSAAPQGVLSWDGQAWAWRPGSAAEEAGRPVVALDLQRWLLLRWTLAGGERWLWLGRAQAPAQWRALRRAVHARARSAAPDPAGDEVAAP